MERREHRRPTVDRRQDLATLLGDPEVLTDDRLGSRRAEADEQVRSDDLQLEIEPRTAGSDLRGVRTLMEAPLAARPPLEVLHDVANEDALPVDPGLGEGRIQQTAGRSDERSTGEILAIAGLLAASIKGT
jgi:hypothetical protein